MRNASMLATQSIGKHYQHTQYRHRIIQTFARSICLAYAKSYRLYENLRLPTRDEAVQLLLHLEVNGFVLRMTHGDEHLVDSANVVRRNGTRTSCVSLFDLCSRVRCVRSFRST
jgi:hypothetical protein